MYGTLVKETSTSTGTGNLTLSGAADSDHITFNTQFGTDLQFYYYIIDTTNNAWEAGIGHLSASTTLVRDTVLRSSNADAAVNFSAGTKTVLNDMAENGVCASFGFVESADLRPTINVTGANTNVTLVADRIHYAPYFGNFLNDIDGLSAAFNTVSGTSTARLGLYTCEGGIPVTRVVQSASFTPAVGENVQSITQRNLGNRWWFIGIGIDNNDVLRGKHQSYISGSPIRTQAGFGLTNTMFQETLTGGWTDLPATAGTLLNANNQPGPSFRTRTA